MEYLLHNTVIFDEDIGDKFNAAIKTSKEKFDEGKNHKLIVCFHVRLLNDPRFESFFIPEPSKANRGSRTDKIYDVLSTQLNRLEQTMCEHGIEVNSATIQGEQLEVENVIKITVSESASEPHYSGKGKNKNKIKVSSIVPSLPYTQENIANLASKRISEMYSNFIDTIRDNKIMSEILDIDETEDDRKLIEAYVKQYGTLWLATNDREKELRNRLIEKSTAVLNKYIKKADSKGKTEKEQV